MKKSIWNKGLYLEGLRRLRGLMITFSALIIVFVVAFSVILRLLGVLAGRGDFGTYLTWPFLIFVFIGAPAFAFKTFSFLNKRGSSDFFHALPYTRTCMYISLLTSLIVGIAAVVAVSGAAAFIAYAFLRVGADTVREVAIFTFCSFVSSLFTASIVVLSSSVSGSVFTELVLSGVILIFPQVITYVFNNFVYSSVYTASGGGQYDLAGSMKVPDFNNLPLRLFMSYVGGSAEDMTEPVPLIYSAVVCVLYLVGAYLLFRFRKSETAERSAPSLKIQAVFRVILACAFSFIGTLELIRGIIDGSYVYNYLPTVIILYTIAAIAYFIFELISTKDKRNIFKALPVFGIVIALNIAFAGLFYGVFSYEYSFGTKPEQVNSITVYAYNSYIRSVKSLTDTAYCACLREGYKINGEDTVNDICNNIAYANEHGSRSSAGNYMRFNIKSGPVTKQRSLNILTSLETKIKAEIKQSKKYKKYLKLIPSQIEDKDPYEFVGISLNEKDVKKNAYGYEKIEKVLYALRAEVKDVDADEWESYLKSKGAENDVYVQYYTSFGYLKIPLSETYTPNAYKTAMEALGKN